MTARKKKDFSALAAEFMSGSGELEDTPAAGEEAPEVAPAIPEDTPAPAERTTDEQRETGKTKVQSAPAAREESPEAPAEEPQTAATKVQIAPAERPPAGYKIDPRYVETRSRRVQIVLQPSLYGRVKAAADAAGLSLNSYVSAVLKAVTEQTQEQ